jgi:hypothetical protein
MVHFPGFARTRLWIHRAVRRFYPRGFPHSEIPGSKPACGSPRLIAACHVLLRLLLPRHPPCALSSLTIKFARHTAARPLSKLSFRAKRGICFSFDLQTPVEPPHARKFYGPQILLIARLYFSVIPCALGGEKINHGEHKGAQGKPRTPAGFLQALIKLRRLVNCPIYSVVKYRPLEPGSQLSALCRQRRSSDSITRLDGFGFY